MTFCINGCIYSAAYRGFGTRISIARANIDIIMGHFQTENNCKEYIYMAENLIKTCIV